MAEPKKPKRPPIGTPEAPLPRLWKAEPEEDDEETLAKAKKAKAKKEEEAPPPPKPKPKPSIWLGKNEKEALPKEKEAKAKKKAKAKDKEAKKGDEGKEGEPKGVLKEETPVFDTYETRQRVRTIVGVAIACVFLLGGIVFYKVFLDTGEEAPPADDPIPREMLAIQPSTAATQPQRDEEEARQFFDRAREVSRNNKTLAIALLKRLSVKYPNTPAAQEAKEALDRPSQNPPLPLFLDRPAVVAERSGQDPAVARTAPAPSTSTSTPATASGPKGEGPKPEAPPTVVAEATRRPDGGGQASLSLPANPAEAPADGAGPVAMAPSTAPPPASAGPASPNANLNPNPNPNPNPGAAPQPSIAAKALPKGFRPRQGTEIHESGWPMEIVGDRDGALMLLVPGGTFIQGRDDADPNEGPAHRVALGTFYIDRHEVTVRQFNLFQKEAGQRADRVRALGKDPAHAKLDDEEDRPVVMVSARDAKDFADWAGKFLPTEAQWEAAARTTDGRIFPWGPEPPAWTKPRAPRQIDPVMTFPSDVSPYGVYDLAGNAWEWTKDWYDRRYYDQFRTTPANNPAGPVKPKSQQLVVKGSAKDWTVSKREGFKYDIRLPYLGFRCVLQVEGPGNAFEPPPAEAPAAPGQGRPGGAPAVIPF